MEEETTRVCGLKLSVVIYEIISAITFLVILPKSVNLASQLIIYYGGANLWPILIPAYIIEYYLST